MSLSGTTNTYLPPTLDGLNIIEADAIYINGIPINTENLVPYTGASKNVNLGTFNFQTLGSITAKQHVFPTFGSTMMTGAMTSSIFYADAWEFNNTIQISSLGGGSFLSTSYLRLADGSNNSTLLTLQSDGIADFGNSIPRASTLAVGNYDLVNLSTLSNAVAYLEGITSLNFVPYVGSLNNLEMGGSTITTTGLMSAGAVRITSSLSNIDYAISVNGSDQLEFTNLTTSQTLKTDGASLFIPGNVNCYSGTVFSNDLQLSGTSFLAYGTASQFGTTLNSSGEYEIQDDAGVMRLRLSKSTGLTVSTLNITQVPSATPTFALGVNGGGQVVSFAVPSGGGLLTSNNTWTGTNQFNNRVLLNTATSQGSLTVYNSTDSLPGGGSGSALAIFAPISTDSALIFGCSANTTFAIRSSGSLSNPTLALYSPVIPGMLTFTQNEATMTHGGNSFSLGNTRFLTSTVNSGVSSASVLAVSPTTISSSGGTYTALANSTTTEFRMRILANWIGGVNYTLTMVNTNWSNIKAPILITVQSPTGTTIGSATPTTGATSQVLFTYPQGANGNIYIYIYYAPLGPTPSFSWTTLSVVANVLRSNLYSTGTALALNTTVPSFAGFALQSTGAPVGAGNGTTIENFIVGDVSAGTIYTKGYSIGFNSGSGTTIACQQTSAGSGTTFYGITSQASYHSWKSQPGTANSVDMVLDYNSGNGGIRLNKNGSSRASTYLLDVAGDTLSNGFILEGGGTYAPGCIYSDVNWGMLFRAKVVSSSGIFGWYDSAGTEKMKMLTNGSMTHTAGDLSYMKYGPNATWSSYLVVGATPNRVASVDTAQVITTNGNLHLDAGNSRDMYYGYYANSNGTPNTHQFYGTTFNFASNLPQNNAGESQVVVMSGTTLKKTQCMQRMLYFNNNVAWGGGINITYAFYLYNTLSPIHIFGKNSGYYSGAGMMQTAIRLYCQSTGIYTYLYQNAFVNNGYNHFTVPLTYIINGGLLGGTGWYDVYVYSSSGWITDGNDQLTISVQILPVSGF